LDDSTIYVETRRNSKIKLDILGKGIILRIDAVHLKEGNNMSRIKKYAVEIAFLSEGTVYVDARDREEAANMVRDLNNPRVIWQEEPVEDHPVTIQRVREVGEDEVIPEEV